MADVSELLIRYARAAAKCQGMELACVTKLVIIEEVKAFSAGLIDNSPHRERIRKLAKRTLGQSVSQIANTLDLPEFKDALQKAIDARNRLHHSFFIDHDIESDDLDVAAAIRELNEIEVTLTSAAQLVWDSVMPLVEAFERAKD